MRKNSKGVWSTAKNVVRVGVLIGCVSAHVDDLGLGGSQQFKLWLRKEAEARFGPVRQQDESLLHVGAQYTTYPDSSMSMDLCEYIDLIEEADVPKDRTAPLDSHGLGELMRVNGSLGYGSKFRPDAKGPVAVAQSGTAGTPTGEQLVIANKAPTLLKEDNHNCRLRFPKLRGTGRKMCVIADSNWKNIRTTHSQNAWTVLLCERWEEEDVGGRGHDLEDVSRAATRVAKSSFGGELLAATAGAEAGHRRMKLWDESHHGAESAAELRDRPYPIPLQVVGDAA